MKKEPLRDVMALIGQENVQLRLGTSLTTMKVHLPSDVTLENKPKWEWKAQNGSLVRVSIPDIWVKWKYNKEVVERLAEGCLYEFLRQRKAPDQEIVNFVSNWGPLGMNGCSRDGEWCWERLSYWRGAARSAYALVRLTQELRNPETQGKRERMLADLWRQVPFKPNDKPFAIGLSNRVSTPEGVSLDRFSSDLDPKTLSQMSVAYQKALLASWVSQWLVFSQASPQIRWVGEHPSLTFSKIAQDKLCAEDRLILSEHRNKMMHPPVVTWSYSGPSPFLSFPILSPLDAFVGREHEPSTLQETDSSELPGLNKTNFTSTRFDEDLPSTTFLAIALQLAAAVLGDANVFVCENCGEVSTSVKAHGRGRPAKYCSPDCSNRAKVIQRRNTRIKQRQQKP